MNLAQIEIEAGTARAIGLQAIYAMKADAYQVSLTEGRLFTLDCFLMIGEYHGIDMDEPNNHAFVQQERDRVIAQADFVGGHIIEFLQSKGISVQGDRDHRPFLEIAEELFEERSDLWKEMANK